MVIYSSHFLFHPPFVAYSHYMCTVEIQFFDVPRTWFFLILCTYHRCYYAFWPQHFLVHITYFKMACVHLMHSIRSVCPTIYSNRTFHCFKRPGCSLQHHLTDIIPSYNLNGLVFTRLSPFRISEIQAICITKCMQTSFSNTLQTIERALQSYLKELI